MRYIKICSGFLSLSFFRFCDKMKKKRWWNAKIHCHSVFCILLYRSAFHGLVCLIYAKSLQYIIISLSRNIYMETDRHGDKSETKRMDMGLDGRKKHSLCDLFNFYSMLRRFLELNIVLCHLSTTHGQKMSQLYSLTCGPIQCEKQHNLFVVRTWHKVKFLINSNKFNK